MELLAMTPVSVDQICIQTECNPLLSKLKFYMHQGWPMEVESSPKLLLSQGRIKDELSLHNGCLLHMVHPLHI